MSRQAELGFYIARLQRRLRIAATLRGVAILAGTALVVTVALVVLLNRYAFPSHAVAQARWALIAALTLCAALALGWPLRRLTRTRAVHRAEAAHPELEQRLTTLHERRDDGNPFLELLAAETLRRTEQTAPPSSLAPAWTLCAFAGAGLAFLGVLLWMVAAGPGYLGYGASLLWKGAKPNVTPLYALAVKPGDVAVRRNSDQLIAAELIGLHPDKVQLFAHYGGPGGSTGAWEPVLMQPDLSSAGSASSTGPAQYHFLFTGLPEDVEYYVAAGPLVSPHYRVRVVDLPSVKAIQVTYHYPKWTGMTPVTEEHSGDLRAIEGTDAAIEIETDRPLKDGQLTLDGGKTIRLTADAGQANRYRGTVHMDKDGAYHLAAIDSGQAVRLSEDYFIATDKAMPPEVAIDRPGRDYRASPIEEVTVGVKATDSFALHDLHLHYSVNGGPDKDVSLLKAPGAKNADGSYTLRLEDYKLVPGDLVSLYATARDGHAEARTDITFIQADPFEREFSQSQQSGGGGGGGGGQGNDQTEISKREKELIAQTWKQVNDKNATPKDAATQGQFLADAQNKLRDQVMALSARMQSRDLSQANEEFTGFEKDMQTAAAAMAPSADKLKGTEWKDALPLEQKALQSLLRAEATFRQIQVAFGQQGGGGGGGGAGRDLASLFDLELDTAKNQYETAQTASPEAQHAKEVEDALEKLDALAKRQEELASADHNPQQSFQERWQQEMLRREAEQLQRQMEQLAQNSQGQQGQQGQQGGQGGQQSGQQNGGQQAGQQGGQAGSQSGSSGGQSGSSGGQQASEQGSTQSGSQAGSQGKDQGAGSRPAAGSRAGKQSGGGAADQRVQQALSRLRQAGEAMKRSGSGQAGSQPNNEAARQAADRLREATEALGGEQQQLASGSMDSLSREADRLAQEERVQAERINKFAGSQGSYSADVAGYTARRRDLNQLASDRQQLSNDLSRLQKNVRDSARAMAPNQPGVAQKLRDALSDMDQTDLDNHVQRTADRLRLGVNPDSNGTETEIAQGLQKLGQQLRQAEQAMGQGGGQAGKDGQTRGAGARAGTGDEVAALNQVERLRSQLEAMANGQTANGRPGQANGQSGNRPEQNGPAQGRGSQGQERQSLQRGGGQGQGGSQQGQNGASAAQRQQGAQQGQGQQGQDGQQGQQAQGNGSGRGGQRSGQPGGQRGGNGTDRGGQTGDLAGNRGGTSTGTPSGDVRYGGGGGNDGTVWGNVNTGNNRYAQGGQRPAPTDATGNPADTQRTIQQYQQGMRELSQLRGLVGSDPQAAKDVQELTRQMQRLDPSRFPGNPAMVEQMHREVLSAVDKLELQLNHDGSSEAHTGKPDTVPAGYGDSVAEYYKKLSSNNRP